MKKATNKIIIFWNDILMYHPDTKIKLPSQMKTEGTILKETDGYFIVFDQKTIKVSSGDEYPQKKPKYFFIPKSLIYKIEQ